MAELGYRESIGDLVKGVLSDLRQLMREEIALARVEMREQATRAKLAIAALGTAALALAFGGIFLLLAIAIGLADLLHWPTWAGLLTMAFLLCIGGLALLAAGRKRLRTVHAMPEQTVETIKENSEWIAKRLSSAKK
jgi:uncharacterized membrane protein YqjE